MHLSIYHTNIQRQATHSYSRYVLYLCRAFWPETRRHCTCTCINYVNSLVWIRRQLCQKTLPLRSKKSVIAPPPTTGSEWVVLWRKKTGSKGTHSKGSMPLVKRGNSINLFAPAQYVCIYPHFMQLKKSRARRDKAKKGRHMYCTSTHVQYITDCEMTLLPSSVLSKSSPT